MKALGRGEEGEVSVILRKIFCYVLGRLRSYLVIQCNVRVYLLTSLIAFSEGFVPVLSNPVLCSVLLCPGWFFCEVPFVELCARATEYLERYSDSRAIVTHTYTDSL